MTALVCAGIASGCAGRALVHDKPGVRQAQRGRDENACLRSAVGSDGAGRLLAAYKLNGELYRQCMRARGYTLQAPEG